MLKTSKTVIGVIRSLNALQMQSRCSSMERQSKMLQKLMTGKKRVGFKWGETHATQKMDSIEAPKKDPTKMTSKRSIVLNKMFMRHVTDLIASGPIGYDLSGFGLEITRVKVCQHYHGLNIFWTATATDDFDIVEEKLELIKNRLRHELHQMQVMGNVPHLTFVRDRELSYFDELDVAISKADYGEDYEPDHLRNKLDNKFEVRGEKMDQEQNETNSFLPPMRNDVFGLDHALFMGRIKQSMAKSRQAWKAYEQNNMKSSYSDKPFSLNTSFESIREEHTTERQSADILREFLQRRKLMKKLKKSQDRDFETSLHEDDEPEWKMKTLDENDNWIEDEYEVQRFYDEYEPLEK